MLQVDRAFVNKFVLLAGSLDEEKSFSFKPETGLMICWRDGFIDSDWSDDCSYNSNNNNKNSNNNNNSNKQQKHQLQQQLH